MLKSAILVRCPDLPRLLAGIAGALLFAGNAFGLGLGGAVGQVILGQPLRVEIPLLGTEAGLPAAECFRVRPPQVETEPGYVVKGARVEVTGERGRARLVVIAAPPVREPVVEFAVTVACGFDLTRDFLLLSSLPPKVLVPEAVSPPTAAPAVAPRIAVPPVEPAKPASPQATAGTAPSLRIDADTTLEALAQRHYPLQPKAREKYMRMMGEANAGVEPGTIIATGTQLRIPAGLPVRREGPYRPEAAKPVPAPLVALPAAAPVKRAAGAPSKDVLRLGVAPERSNAELLVEAERLTAALMEQARVEDEIAANLTRLEGAFTELKQHYLAVEDRLAHIEAERQAEKAAAKSHSVGFIELLLAVLAGGALGGFGLHLYNRKRALPDTATDRFDAPTVAAYLGSEPPTVAHMPSPKAERPSLSFTEGK